MNENYNEENNIENEKKFKNDNLNKKTTTKIINYFIVFFVGCLAMYAVVYFFPTSITESITKLEKDVTVTDSGIADAVEKIYDAVVIVATYKNDTAVASGTGFVYKQDGDTYYILTNYHVIEDGNNVKVTFTDGTQLDTVIVGHDEYADIAVLSIETKEELIVAEIGNNDESRVGDTVFAVGAPLDNAYSWTVTRGIISGKDREVAVSLSNSNVSDYIMKVLQTDTAINSGNSGGPLCNANGEVVGVTSLKLVSSGVEGMGFAIPIEDAISKAEEIISGVVKQYPYLGISMLDVSSVGFEYYSLIKNSGLDSGVIVASVDKGSAADEGGIEQYDIIVALNNKSITNIAYLKYYLYQYEVGDTVTFTVNRNGKNVDVKVKLGTDKQTT